MIGIKNFICYHKNFLIPSARQSPGRFSQEFVSIFAVGPDRYQLAINPDVIDGDGDVSENRTIAQENSYYCELTMHFHVWRNCLSEFE